MPALLVPPSAGASTGRVPFFARSRHPLPAYTIRSIPMAGGFVRPRGRVDALSHSELPARAGAEPELHTPWLEPKRLAAGTKSGPAKPLLALDVATSSSAKAASALQTLASFSGVSFATDAKKDAPPDTQVAAGPGSVVEALNAEMFVYSPSGVPESPVDLSSFFAVPANYFFTDPRIFYDTAAGRFFLSGFAFDAASDSMTFLAVSDSSDPLGQWTTYEVDSMAGVITDQPKIGESNDKVVMSWDDYDATGKWLGQETWVLERSDLLSAQAVSEDHFGPDTSTFDPVPAVTAGETDTAYLVYNDSCGPDTVGDCNRGTSDVGLVAINGTPAGGDLTWGEVDLPIAATSVPPAARQPGGAPAIDTNDDRLLSVAWQNGDLWATANDGCTPSGDSAARSCIRLLELSVGSTPSVVLDGDLSEAGDDLYYPAVALDQLGDPLLVASLSSATVFPSVVALTGSAASSDFTGVSLADGSGTYNCSFCGGDNRWGDYSGAAADPSDPADVWLAGEYAPAPGGDEWGTAIGELTLAEPTVESVSPSTGSVLGGSAVTVRGTGFAPGATVSFGTAVSPAVSVISGTVLVATAPAQLVIGPVDVTVTTGEGTSPASPSDQFDYTPPPPKVTVTAPLRPFELSSTIDIAYSGADAYSPVASYDIRYAFAPWSSVYLGSYLEPPAWQATTSTSETLAGVPGDAYCFQVRARTPSGVTSPWSRQACTALPLGAQSLRVLRGPWASRSLSGYYLGRAFESTTAGAELQLRDAQASLVAIVATECPSCGRIAAYVNGRLLAVVNTAAPTVRHGVLITLPPFSPRKATVVLEASSPGKRVIVEGLGIA